MDLTTATARIQLNLNRYDLTDVGSEIIYWVNAECRRWHERALWPASAPNKPGVAHDWSFLMETAAYTTVAADADYALPTDFLRPVRLVWEVDDAPVRPRLGHWARLAEQFTGSDDDAPATGVAAYAIDRKGSLLLVYPTPDDVYTGTLWYVIAYTDLVNGADTNDFLTLFWDGIVAGATARALRTLKVFEQAAQWRQEADAALLEAIASDRESEDEPDVDAVVLTDTYATESDPRPLMSVEDVPPYEEG